MTVLHGGTVTFVFTDIEGSTELLERAGSNYAPILDRHRAIIREAIAAHGGVEHGTEGDSFFVSFETATAAVDAAVEAQLRRAGERRRINAPAEES